MRTNEVMGDQWQFGFRNEKFLDQSGCPLPLTVATGPNSVANLVRASHIRISLISFQPYV